MHRHFDSDSRPHMFKLARLRAFTTTGAGLYWRFASLRNGAMVSPWCMTIHDTRSSLPCDILQRHPPFHLQEGPDLRTSLHGLTSTTTPSGLMMKGFAQSLVRFCLSGQRPELSQPRATPWVTEEQMTSPVGATHPTPPHCPAPSWLIHAGGVGPGAMPQAGMGMGRLARGAVAFFGGLSAGLR